MIGLYSGRAIVFSNVNDFLIHSQGNRLFKSQDFEEAKSIYIRALQYYKEDSEAADAVRGVLQCVAV